LNNERRHPKKIVFPGDIAYTSIKDVRVSGSFTLALSEEGTLYSWGLGLNGRLGLGDEGTRLQPERVPFDFRDEEKRLKKLKKQHKSLEEIEELITLHSFVKSSSGVGGT
jgi:alpha-tubulin suppressor-like RCC1 family protein